MPKVPPGIIPRPLKSGKLHYGVKVYEPSVKNGCWVGTYDTLAEAREAKRKAELGRHSGEAMSVEEYFAIWPSTHPRPCADSMARYRSSLGPFIETFGRRSLHKIGRVEALQWAARVPVSVSDTVRLFLNDALDDGLLTHNPFAALGLSRPRGRKDLEVISTAQLHYLADTAQLVWSGITGLMLRSMILWAAYTAMRPGEMHALRWDWLDFDTHEIAIVSQSDRHGVVKQLKNRDQRISVMLPEAEEAIRALPRSTNSGPIFHTIRGCPFRGPNWHYYWNPIRNAFGRPDMDVYELRHYCATLLLENGVPPADVAIQLGHRDGGRLVMETYGHPSEDAARHRILRLMATDRTDIRPSKSAGFGSHQRRDRRRPSQ